MPDHISLVTQRRPLQVANPNANATVKVSSFADFTGVSTSTPTTSTANGEVVIPGVMNYLKVIPLFQTGSTSPRMRVVGWSYVNGLGVWSPNFLANVSLTLNTSGISVNGTSLLAPHTMSLTAGDAKLVYEGNSNDSNGIILVDTMGADLIELVFEASAGTSIACNALIGEV
jgi:hypothetical protein